MDAARLLRAIQAAGVQVVDVIIGQEQARETWRVVPPSLQPDAQPIINAYVDPTPNTLLDEYAEKRVSDKAIIAVAHALWECIPAPTMTKAQLMVRVKVIYKSL